MTKILLPVEDKDSLEAQIEFVSKHALPSGCQITILVVVAPLIHPDCGLSLPSIYVETIAREQEKACRQLLDDTAAQLKKMIANVTIEKCLEYGHPATEILRISKEGNFDWIVLGSHGRAGLEKFLLGSVAIAVTNHAPCCVSIVRRPGLSKGEKSETKEAIMSST